MKLRDGDLPDEVTLNLTSLIDVIFQLLVFFMLSTTFLRRERSLDIDLPTASQDGESPARELVVDVFRDGRLALAGRPLDLEGLRQELRSEGERDAGRAVTIRGDADARHQAIVDVMDACGAAGLHNLAVGTRDLRAGG